jgi:hypothetical protein
VLGLSHWEDGQDEIMMQEEENSNAISSGKYYNFHLLFILTSKSSIFLSVLCLLL